MDLNENLKRIKQLSEELKTLPEIAHITKYEAKYDTEYGGCFGVGLFNVDKVAVQQSTLEPHTRLDIHMHAGMKEILICYEGDLQVITNAIGESVVGSIIYAGGVVVIDPYVPHIVQTVNGCKVIGITVPASLGYPNQKHDSDGK
jgi:quercetin dioxygenase-like cupin family protein